jgi:tRNA(Ile)-lysidine synthase
VQERVLRYIGKHGLMRPGDRVSVAVSGGADSVALLRLLLEARAELGIVLSVVHFNHKIRGAEADADERFARELAGGLGLEFHCDSADTPAYAREHKISLEAAGRKLRYGFFDRLTAAGTVHRVATAHTRDDQAETILMRFLRGSGTKGLAGIYPGIGGWFVMGPGHEQPEFPPGPRIVRPLLEISRDELRAYLQVLGQTWREDASNADVSFTRNRLRHEILPLLRQLNPNLDQVLGETAEIAREEESWWSKQTSEAQEGLWAPHDRRGSLGEPHRMRVGALLAQPLAVQRRLVRLLLQNHALSAAFEHVEAVLALAGSQTTLSERVVELPQGWEAVCCGKELWLRNRCQKPEEPAAYDLALPVPREIEVAGRKIRASLVQGEELANATARHGSETRATQVLLDAELAQEHLRVRNWRAGDRYWPAHTREPKKLKELLQARHIPRQQKAYWPVVVRGEEIVWVPGFEAPERFRARETGSEALLLEEVSGEPHPGKTS